VFFDSEKSKPVFTDAIAKHVFRALQTKGGAEYPILNSYIEKGISTLGSYLPSIIANPISGVMNGATNTFVGVKNFIPFGDLLLETMKTGAAVSTSTIEAVAGAFGGAPGELIAAVLSLMIASAAASVHILERDFGGAIEQIFRALPVVGPTLQTILQKSETFAGKINGQYDKIMETVGSVRGNIEGKLAQLRETPVGGKRLSTKKNTYYKWRKTTQRN